MSWSSMTREQRREAASKGAEAGYPASKIAAIHGTTKDAVIAFCRRQKIKLPGGQKPPKHRAAPRSQEQVREITDTNILPPDASPVPFLEALERRLCKWPLWPEFETLDAALCCGARREIGQSYCDYHREIHRGNGTWSERNALEGLKI